MSMATAGAAPVERKEVPSWRLLALMTSAGAIAGALIVSVYQLTLPRIERHKSEVERAAVLEVLKSPASFDTLYLVQGDLVKTLPAGTQAKGLEKVYLGRDASGKRVGFAVSGTGNGFQEPITVMFGYDASAHAVIAMKVISNKETPGLGDKIVKDTMFVHEFAGAVSPLAGVKRGNGKVPSDVEMITGATISSRAVIQIINNAIARWQPLMDKYTEVP
jgi:Na+-translocating ferredoxin:NAD+ oxidoreductase subunit G